jgi:UDP-GlcNAc:undecaprenyl-phosphate GlcNAc-1-phosphate transferase
MKTYLALFVSSACISVCLTSLILRFSKKYGIGQDPSGERKIHSRSIPRLGGIAIFLSVIATLSLLLSYDNGITRVFSIHLSDIQVLFIPATMLFLVGLLDDLRGLNPWFKLSAQLIAALLCFWLGLRIELVTNPFSGQAVALGWLALPVTVLWLVGVTNAFNLVDGMDGLAGGLACLISMSVGLMALLNGQILVAVFAVTIVGATLGFLRFNFHPARIFMGDGGSYFLGFLLAALAVRTGEKSSFIVSIAIPLLVLGVPILETGVTILRRLLAGKPLFQADGGHIHHMLLRGGVSHRVIVLVMYLATAVFGLTAFVLVVNRTMGIAVIMVLVSLLLALIFTRLGYHEFREFGDLMERAFFFQRRILSNQIFIRAAASRLTESRSPAELFNQLVLLFHRLEFCRAQLNVTVACKDSAWRMFNWDWSPGESSVADLPGSGCPDGEQVWSLRIPLVTDRRLRARLQLSRSLGSNRLYFQVYSLVDLLGGQLHDALLLFTSQEYDEYFKERQALAESAAAAGASAPQPGLVPSHAFSVGRSAIRSVSRMRRHRFSSVLRRR